MMTLTSTMKLLDLIALVEKTVCDVLVLLTMDYMHT